MAKHRLDKAQTLMAENGVDVMIVGPSADFSYLVGVHARPTERFLGLIVPQAGSPVIISPKLEASTYTERTPEIRVVAWGDGQDPFRLLDAEIEQYQPNTIAVNEDMWAAFVLDMQKTRPNVKYRLTDDIVGILRQRKDEEEVALLAAAASRIDAVWADLVSSGNFVGQTELQIRSRIRGLMVDHGFDEIGWIDVGAGPNGAIPVHHGSDYVIQDGDPVVIDFAGTYRGYWADICRTPVAGAPDPEFVEIYEVVARAQEAAFQTVGVGVPCEDVDAAARTIIEQAGYGDYFTHRVGHGIGLAAHEHPYIIGGNDQPLDVGMVFSDEPGIYIPDRWGVRIEDIVVVTVDGPRRLNGANRELVVVS